MSAEKIKDTTVLIVAILILLIAVLSSIAWGSGAVDKISNAATKDYVNEQDALMEDRANSRMDSLYRDIKGDIMQSMEEQTKDIIDAINSQ
jgi:hypothetical protein